ncbi:MAG: HEAT repeat domain-containing protein [Verrucomicrobiota bacterium]|jgi:hypothetical protein
MLARLKRILIGVAVGLALLAGAVWLLIHTLGERETLYQGKTLYYWVGQMNSPAAALSNQTRLVLDTEIIPQLARTMFHDTNDSPLRLALIEELNSLPGVQIYFPRAGSRRAWAANSLGTIGPGARQTIPDLIKALKGNDPAVRPAAARALGQLQGQPDTVIPLLIACLDDPQEGVPEAAAEALGLFGPRSKAAAPKLLQLLKIPDKDLQAAIRLALKRIDPEVALQAAPK